MYIYTMNQIVCEKNCEYSRIFVGQRVFFFGRLFCRNCSCLDHNCSCYAVLYVCVTVEPWSVVEEPQWTRNSRRICPWLSAGFIIVCRSFGQLRTDRTQSVRRLSILFQHTVANATRLTFYRSTSVRGECYRMAGDS